ncbi:hypothetical protein PMAYCL1PPCAC_27916, partial [Pristionchus mayeri]
TIKKEEEEDGLEVEIGHFPSNLPFYDLTRLDWGRIERLMYGDEPNLRVYLTGPEDPVIEQLSHFLSSFIKYVIIGEDGTLPLSSSDLSACAMLLQASTIGNLRFDYVPLDETTAPSINSLIPRVTNNLSIKLDEKPQLTDYAAFIETLSSHSIGSVILRSHENFSHPNTFFGLSRSFWKTFVNE